MVYQHAWSMGERACKTPRGYVEARLAAIRGALRKAVPDAPIDIPVFYGGCTGEDEAVSYLGEGLFDGIFVDDRQWSPRSFCSVIERVCGCERP
ncbi:triose-phosphate isomerase [Raoultibacter timonensis]|uniref:triose-phosphate isomerase n=1 Tax=Raoultibacter timonensis TaxID=1907662 RepID=UPI0011AF0A08|nr:triose-phosphate isomerase [Raoultibacter timonensis]